MPVAKFRTTRFTKASFALRSAIETGGIRMLVLGFSLLLLTLAGLVFLNAQHELDAAISASQDLKRNLISENRPEAFSVKRKLPVFDGAFLIKFLQDGAAVADVAINEVTFSVDSPLGQPFGRYRANFAVSSNYPSVRKFVSHILSGTEGLVLDTVSCVRKETQVVDVTCEFGVYVPFQQ